MKAKVTVISPEQLEAIIQERFPIFELNEEDEEERKATIEAIAKAQAEITWPIAEKAGMKKVVEWVREHGRTTYERAYGEITLDSKNWQAFCKEIET